MNTREHVAKFFVHHTVYVRIYVRKILHMYVRIYVRNYVQVNVCLLALIFCNYVRISVVIFII